MVQSQTVLDVVDNSGVKQIKCIEVLGKARHGIGSQGDVIVASVLSVGKKKVSSAKEKNQGSATSTWKKGTIVRALIVRTKKINSMTQGMKTKTGSFVRFPSQNAAILLASGQTKHPKNPLASRIMGSLPGSLRKKGFTKVLSIGGKII